MSDDLYIGPTALEPGPKEPRHSRAADHLARFVMMPLVLALIIIVLVFYVFFSSAVVSGPSMMPTLLSGDYLLVTHGDSSPSRGDVIVTGVLETTGPVELVKRVIALPGDTVEIRNDVAYVNGVVEPQRGQLVIPQYAISQQKITVPRGYVYVMGDNRAVSEDSRYLGSVPVSGIKGRAVFVFAPINRVRPV